MPRVAVLLALRDDLVIEKKRLLTQVEGDQSRILNPERSCL